MDRAPPYISPLPWGPLQAYFYQGRKAGKVTWLGFYASGHGKGFLPVHSIKPSGMADSPQRIADAYLMRAAPQLYAALVDALPYLPEAECAAALAALGDARGECGAERVPLMGEVYDLV